MTRSTTRPGLTRHGGFEPSFDDGGQRLGWLARGVNGGKYPRHLFALGYGGHGMTFGFLAAQLLLDCYRGKRPGDQRLFAFDR